MTDSPLLRLALLLAAGACVWVVTLGIRWMIQRRTQAVLGQQYTDVLPTGSPARAVTVLAFSSRHCVECRARQAPVLSQLRTTLDAVQIVHVDAAADPQRAATFNILTVPSTVVLDGAARVVAVNHGFAPLDRLTGQIARAAASA